MNREIDRFINSVNSLIKPTYKLVIENNPEVIAKAVRSGSFKELLDQMSCRIRELKKGNYNVNQLKYNYNLVKKIFNGLSGLLTTIEPNGRNEYLQGQINESESNLRRAVRTFFDTYKKYLENTRSGRKVSVEVILKKFPALKDVFPQVDYKSKRVLVMTVHKAMYGIDPILTEKVQLANFVEKKKTLILFDESDQAAVCMRNAIIDQAIQSTGDYKRFAKGYNGYLQYKNLIDIPEHISNEYYGALLEKCIDRAQVITQTNWKQIFKDIKPYKNIFLEDVSSLDNYRRGVFFSGPIFRLNVSQKGDKGDKIRSFICYKRGDRHFRLVHTDDDEKLKSKYVVVVTMDRFLSLVSGNTTAIKSQFRNVITKALGNSRKTFEEEIKAVANNTATQNQYLSYPTLEREIHTLFSRFETTSEYQFEQQMYEFMTNRKNISIKGSKGDIKLPDFSVYSQGVQFFQEEVDERDNLHRVRLSCREITTTPEKIIVNLANSSGASVVLCSATASGRSVVSNYDIKYLKQILGNKVHNLLIDEKHTFDKLVSQTYPSGHKVEIVPLEKFQYPKNDPNRYEIPEKYKKMFSKEAQEEGLIEKWFRITIRDLSRNLQPDQSAKDVSFQIYRLFQFIEAYHWFYTHDDIHSMLYFQNRTGDKDRNQINVICCLIDGSYKDYPELDIEIPSDWENKHIRISKDWEEVETSILKELGEDNEAKIMLVSAYGSFKAGANLQYSIPYGLDYIAGDNWDSSDEKLKKDWDAVYLQAPAGYMMINEDGNEQTYERSLYNAMLVLMMLYERGCLSKEDVASWMGNALSNKFYFGEKNNPGITRDKSAWVQTVVEQAIGRLCRTRNKPHTTYILYDRSMTPFFDKSVLDKSLTKEFKELVQYVLTHSYEREKSDNPDEVIRCNNANYVQGQLDRIREIALKYTPHPYNDNDSDDEEEEDISYNVMASQMMIQSYKKLIISKPVISSLDDLTEEEKRLTFRTKCYGDWIQNGSNEFIYGMDGKRICPINKGNVYPMSPSTVRLDVLMKNNVIREYFISNGYATEWKSEGLILHPNILAYDYAGEIGEEAFKALVLHYTDCTEKDLVHLKGKVYEVGDFVIKNADGTNKIAFDVKNWNPDIPHYDRPGDMPTAQKRAEKRKSLDCEIIFVNLLDMRMETMDGIREIGGLITEDGVVIQSAIERIRQLING